MSKIYCFASIGDSQSENGFLKYTRQPKGNKYQEHEQDSISIVKVSIGTRDTKKCLCVDRM